jgi:amino-acid N-acetyltransferase
MRIRKAVVGDVKTIHKILNHYADQGLLLPRSLSEFYDHLRDYFVLADDAEIDLIYGVCGLGVCWEDLAEIKSLAVTDDNQGKGFGSQLVEACLKEARSLGLKKVFALTYVPDFFIRLGFHEVEKLSLPHKIWADCLKCPKFPNCDETALMIKI